MIPMLWRGLSSGLVVVGTAGLYVVLPQVVSAAIYQVSDKPDGWLDLAKDSPLLFIIGALMWYCRSLVTEIREIKRADDARTDAQIKVMQELITAVKGLDERIALGAKVDEIKHLVAERIPGRTRS